MQNTLSEKTFKFIQEKILHYKISHLVGILDFI